MLTTDKNDSESESNKLLEVISEGSGRVKNEADTRHKVIDYIIHDYLHWPRNRVSHEEHVNAGYADYIFKKSNGSPLLVLEAKKEGVFFELPVAYKKEEKACYISLKNLITDKNISAAVAQVKNYCFDLGCEYAAISNGHEWIFFKTFEKGKKWDSLNAFVIRDLRFFLDEGTRAYNSFSYISITEKSSLVELLTSSAIKDRNIYSPKEKIAAYSHPITANRLANSLRPIVNKYFGTIGDNDSDFMNNCYVSQREYHTTSDGMRALIQDSLTPYFEQYGVQQLEDTGKGGRLGGRITKNIKNNKPGEVLVLFGGKGSGKSTFIKRLLHHNAPPWLKDHSISVVIDLLKTPESKDVIRQEIWDSLVKKLDTKSLLTGARDELIEKLFKDKFATASKQDLAGLSLKSESYNIKLNALIREWKEDKVYCARKLVDYWSENDVGAIVVVDNTDQFSSEIQDFCFSSAQEISSKLNCVALISMREERFYVSKIHGVLDAFQKSGFHISSPKPSEVFKKRLDYVVQLLSKNNSAFSNIGEGAVRDCIKYLKILSHDFSKDNSPLNSFLTACAHGDIRLSLDLFNSFLLSGYTNVDEMIDSGTWTFKIHQVIKPVMVPTRYFYDEKLSDIPNIYQLRSARHGSHFTSLRILRKLSKGIDSLAPSYFSVAELRGYFAETFNMMEDFEKNLDILLKHGFVEASNRLDKYSIDLDEIKITNYGLYMLNELSHYFTYLDLICTDCGIFDQQVSNYLSEAAKDEYSLFNKREKVPRIHVRLNRVQQFLDYLKREEVAEREYYALGMPESDMFSNKGLANFEIEKKSVLKSAVKQSNSRVG